MLPNDVIDALLCAHPLPMAGQLDTTALQGRDGHSMISTYSLESLGVGRYRDLISRWKPKSKGKPEGVGIIIYMNTDNMCPGGCCTQATQKFHDQSKIIFTRWIGFLRPIP